MGAGMQELVQQFLRTYQARLKPSTLRDYRSILGLHLSRFPTFEALNQELEEYLASLAISGKRKNNVLSACRTFMAWARRREIWDGKVQHIPRFPHRTKRTPALNPDEARLVMDYSPQPYRDFFQFSILSGLRTGEALGLQFGDFNLAGKVIHVRRAMSGGEVGTTKTMSSDRDFPLLRPLWEIYERRKKRNSRSSPWFFYSTHQGLLSLGAIRRAWKDVLAVFEIGKRPLYATRHTFASLAIASGEDPLWVAKIMGHARPDQLFLKYASYLEGVKPDGEKFLDLVGKKTFLRAIT
jgi:integrase